ncbi:MAG: transposase [Psychromonas sp.]|nr:transposase [Psychromonas sp.]
MRYEFVVTLGEKRTLAFFACQPISYTDKMRVKIDSSAGLRQYSKRLGVIEPVFGNITVNKSMNKFTLCGQENVNA